MDPYAAVRQLALRQQEKPSYIDPEATGEAQSAQLPWWTADWGALADTGFQSKFNEVQDLTEYGFPGMFRVTLQNPDPASNHKYDTLDAFYQLDPATGQATLVGEPTPTRQTSSAETVRDFAEHGIPIVAGGLLGGYGLGGGTFGLTGATGAAAGGAATGSGLSLATGGDAGDALKGGLLGAAGGLVKYGANGLLSDVPESNFGNPEVDNLIPQVGSNGELLGQLPSSNFGNPEIDNLIPQVDANGGLLGQPSNFGNPEADNLVDQVTSQPPASNFGNPEADNLVPQVDANGNLLGQAPPPAGGNNLLDKLLTNPKAIGAIAGGLLGGAEGGATDGGSGESYTGPMPTITRGGWSPTATPTYMQLPTTDYQLPTTGYANSGLWRFNGQQQPMPQASPQPFQPQQQPLMQQPQPMQQQGLLGTQQPQPPQQQGLMSQGFGRPQGSPNDLFALAQQKGWIDQGGAPAGNWQNNISKLTAAARKMGLNVGGIDQAFGQAPGTTAGYLGTNTLYDGRQRMLDARAGRQADQEARTGNAGFNRAMSRDNGNGTTGRDTYNAYLMRNGIDWQY